MFRVLAIVAAAIMMALTAYGWAAQPVTDATEPAIDLKSSAAIAAGKRLYDASCSHYCHGPRGGAGIGPKLRGRDFDTTYLYNRISNGFPPMPAWGKVYTSEQIWDLVAYIESLRSAKD